ncbi:hypothetical protein K523DRAFT_325439 [Schizophyllum commune Tattone D]|nr:hypothetical protein K523DRAFT_325439 [Schizophyllum commune Tattone D]
MAALDERDGLTDTQECHSPELLQVDPPAPRHPSMMENKPPASLDAHSQGTSGHASPPIATAALAIAMSSTSISAVIPDSPSEANLDTLSRNIATLKRNIEIHKRRNQKLARRVEELEGQKDEAEAHCEGLEKEREELARERDVYMVRSDTQDAVQREIDALRLELGRIQNALGDAEEDRSERVREAQALKLDLHAKAAELREKEGDLRRQRAELREMGDDLEDKRTELHTMKNEVSSVRTALARSQDARKRAEEDTTRVEGKLSQSNTDREVLSVRASAAEAHAIAAEARAVDAEERTVHALERVAEAEAGVASSSARASDVEARASAAEARAAACEERVSLAQKRTIIAETQEAAIAEELRVAKDALEAAEMQAARAITDKHEMLQSLQVRPSELARIRDEFAQSKDELARAHTEIEETKVELAGKEMEGLEMQAHFVDLRDRFDEISCRLGFSHSVTSEKSSPSRLSSSARTRALHLASASASPYTARLASSATPTASSPSLATPMLAHPPFSMTRPSSVSARSTRLMVTDPSEDPSSGAGIEHRSAHASCALTQIPATLRGTVGPSLDGEDDAAELHFSPRRISATENDHTVRGHHSRSPSASRSSARPQPGFDLTSLSSSPDDAPAPSKPEAPPSQNGVDEESSSTKRPRKRPHSPNAVPAIDISSNSTDKRPRRTRGSKGFPPTSTSSLGRTPLSDRRPWSSRRATRGNTKPVPWETLKPKMRGILTKPRKDTRTDKLSSSAGSSVGKRGARRCAQCARTQEHLTSPRWLSGPLGPASICQICWRNNRKNT